MFKSLSPKLRSMLVAIVASLTVVIVGSVSVTYAWFLSRGSSEYGFVLKADDHVILQYETDLNFANNGTTEDEENCLVPAVAELTSGLDQREYEPIDMFDPSAVETVATAAHFHTKAAYWAGSSVDKGELALKVSATVKGGSSAYDLVEWGEIDYIAIFSYVWDGTDATKKVLYYDGEWYSDIETAASPFIVPLSVTGDQALTTWYVLNDTDKVKISNSIKYLLMSPNREFELDLYAFVAKTDELLDPAINGQTISLSATLNDMTAFVDLGDNTIKFGSYPQTLVVNTQIQRKLNALAGELPTNGNNQGWTSYKYYIDSSNATDYMWYIDVVFRGEKFRGIYFDKYRPDLTAAGSSQMSGSNSFQDDNGYYLNNVYWFKYEAIVWRVLSEVNGESLLLSELALDSQAFQDLIRLTPRKDANGNIVQNANGDTVYDYMNNSQGAPDDVFANNYKYSTIRNWLNSTFYNTSFSEDQKSMILKRTVVNNARSANSARNANEYNNGVNECACENTEDNVFLLSVQEVTNTEYGFVANPWSQTDTARQKKSTDYAKSQGIQVNLEEAYYGNCSWWLRSPYTTSISARQANASGYIADQYDHRIYYGVVPALRMQRSAS